MLSSPPQMGFLSLSILKKVQKRGGREGRGEAEKEEKGW